MSAAKVDITKSPWMDLPRDVWQETIPFLNGVEAWNASLVCKEWQAVFTEECPAVLAPQWHRAEVDPYELHVCINMINQCIPKLRSAGSRIPEVAAWWCGREESRYFKRLFQEIARSAQHFRSMRWNIRWVESNHLSELFTAGRYDNLEKLDFCELSIRYDGTGAYTLFDGAYVHESYVNIPKLCVQVPSFTAISLDTRHLEPVNIAQLAHLNVTTLRTLAMSRFPWTHLRNLKSLTSLEIDIVMPSPEIGASLNACPELKKLNIWNHGPGDARQWLESFVKFEALQKRICDLQIGGQSLMDKDYTVCLAEGFLVNAKNLARLALVHCELDERCTQVLSSLPGLTDLSLGSCTEGFNLATIAKCEKLKVLALSMETLDGNKLFEFGELVQLNACSALTDLALLRTPHLSDRKPIDIHTLLAVLSKLPRLRVLEVPEELHEPISKGLPRLTVYKQDIRLKASA